MSQSTLTIPNQSGATYLLAVNAMAQALATGFSGPTPPAETYPFMPWRDTSVNPVLIKQRDDANSVWVVVGEMDAAGVRPYYDGILMAPAVQQFALLDLTNNGADDLTSVEWTGLSPATAVIHIGLSRASLTGTNNFMLRLGSAGGYRTDGYHGHVSRVDKDAIDNSSAYFKLTHQSGDADVWNGAATIAHLGGDRWSLTGAFTSEDGVKHAVSAYNLDINAPIDRIQLASTAENTFDAGKAGGTLITEGWA